MSRRHIFLLSVVTVFSINCYADDTNTITPSNVFNMAPSNIPTNKNIEENKPRLENYANYNEFINAMYIYNKRQEDNIKPRVIIDLPTKPNQEPEYTYLDSNADVTGKGENIPSPNPEQNK